MASMLNEFFLLLCFVSETMTHDLIRTCPNINVIANTNVDVYEMSIDSKTLKAKNE